MRQAWHIFCKDVRRLWLPAAIAAAAAALLAWADWPGPAAAPGAVRFPTPLAGLLLSLAWLYLTARVIQEEPLPGDRQFWLTRPYSRASLVAAKGTFLLLFLHAPLLLANLAVLLAAGFDTRPLLAGLLWRQLTLAGLLLIPGLVLAAVTRGTTQFALAAVILTGGSAAALSTSSHVLLLTRLPQVSWVGNAAAVLVLAGGGIAATVWQYFTRRTSAARAAALLALASAGALLLLPGELAYAVNDALRPEPAEYRGVTVAVSPAGTLDPPWENAYVVSFPFHVAGLPAEVSVRAEDVSFHLGEDSPAVNNWGAVGRSRERLAVPIRADIYRRLKDRPLRITGTLWFSLLRERVLAEAPFGQDVDLNGLGMCSSSSDAGMIPARSVARMECVFPLRLLLPINSVYVNAEQAELMFVHLGRPWRYSPLPADLGFAALERTVHHEFAVLQRASPGGKPITTPIPWEKLCATGLPRSLPACAASSRSKPGRSPACRRGKPARSAPVRKKSAPRQLGTPAMPPARRSSASAPFNAPGGFPGEALRRAHSRTPETRTRSNSRIRGRSE